MNPSCNKCDKEMIKTSFGWLCLECGEINLMMGREEKAEKFIENMRKQFILSKRRDWEAGNTFYHSHIKTNL